MGDWDDFHERFRAKLQALRVERGMMLVDLEEAGVSPRTFQAIEQGTNEPKLSTLFRVAEALGVEPKDLLDVGDVPRPVGRRRRGGRREAGSPARTVQPSSQRRSPKRAKGKRG